MTMNVSSDAEHVAATSPITFHGYSLLVRVVRVFIVSRAWGTGTNTTPDEHECERRRTDVVGIKTPTPFILHDLFRVGPSFLNQAAAYSQNVNRAYPTRALWDK